MDRTRTTDVGQDAAVWGASSRRPQTAAAAVAVAVTMNVRHIRPKDRVRKARLGALSAGRSARDGMYRWSPRGDPALGRRKVQEGRRWHCGQRRVAIGASGAAPDEKRGRAGGRTAGGGRNKGEPRTSWKQERADDDVTPAARTVVGERERGGAGGGGQGRRRKRSIDRERERGRIEKQSMDWSMGE
ncbi:hypothetical protein MPTK1_2g10150 [Marchantia polymorpha subsp. ruderalis]|uniref:Uncharacterized protein n=1 Tax=Marchantia polymorpha TaxID=3197 RepID=A0A2R6W8L2_MARPO|nr:hypothetical protein MARPO_0129s0039 [Marchantia polymorpha]BBN01769.1 hypothetical protein Mp_2g10150 [Marchantia polymorpha subsp. ruderalis]|eukprot:PTQ30152.1 hypothetical protein MARPO_0129s0039 [Marchantia polymorpha]